MVAVTVWLTLGFLLVVPGGPPAPASAPITVQADHRYGALEGGNHSQDDHEEENETEQQEGDAGRNHNDDNTNDDTQDARSRIIISSFNSLHPLVAHLRFFSRVLASSSFFARTADVVALISDVFAQLFRELSALGVCKCAPRSASHHVHSGVTQLIIIIIIIVTYWWKFPCWGLFFGVAL